MARLTVIQKKAQKEFIRKADEFSKKGKVKTLGGEARLRKALNSDVAPKFKPSGVQATGPEPSQTIDQRPKTPKAKVPKGDRSFRMTGGGKEAFKKLAKSTLGKVAKFAIKKVAAPIAVGTTAFDLATPLGEHLAATDFFGVQNPMTPEQERTIINTRSKFIRDKEKRDRRGIAGLTDQRKVGTKTSGKKARESRKFVYDPATQDIGLENKQGDFIPIGLKYEVGDLKGKSLTPDQWKTIDKMGGEAFGKLSSKQRKAITDAPTRDEPASPTPTLGDTSAFRNQFMQDIQNDQQSVLGNIGDPTITARIARNMAMLNALQPAQTTAKDFITFNRGEASIPGSSLGDTRNLGEGVLDIRTGRPVPGLGGQTGQPPQGSARQAPNGKWYVEQNGKFFEVDNAQANSR